MSNLQRLTKALYGIENYLKNNSFDTKDGNVSRLLIDFLKSKNLPYAKYNPKYKGLFSDRIINSKLVQEHFEDFKKFIINYERF